MLAEEAIMMIPGWNAFPQALQQALLRQSRIRSEKAGSIVFHQGAEVEVIAWTLKGHLFANVHHANGNQTLLTHVPVGRMILFNFIWKHAPIDRNFIAMTDVELLILPRASATQLLAQFDEFKMQVIDSLTERLTIWTGCCTPIKWLPERPAWRLFWWIVKRGKKARVANATFPSQCSSWPSACASRAPLLPRRSDISPTARWSRSTTVISKCSILMGYGRSPAVRLCEL